MSANWKQLCISLQLLLIFILPFFIQTAPVPIEPRLEELESLYNEATAEDDENNRNAIKNPNQLWPSTTLYYRIANDYTPTQTENVHEALRYLSKNTCLKFEEYNESKDGDKRYLNFKSSEKMCGTRVGYNRRTPSGPHDVLLNPYCLARRGVVQHEALHVLGLYHEQSRPDRNNFVAIDYTNIPLRYWSQFTAQPQSQVTTYDVPYDYESIMHYSQNAFAKDPSRPTIRAKEDGELVERNMGQVEAPSEGDLIKIRRMYCEE